MIEFDESEHDECTASDMTFRFIDKQYGRQISERLLYPKPREVAIHAKTRLPQMVGRFVNRLLGAFKLSRDSA